MTISRKFIAAVSKDKIGFLTEQLPNEPGENEILLRSVYSAVSPGTETKTLHQEVPSFKRHWDKEKRIFTTLGDLKKFPAALGYSVVAQVVKTGRSVTKLKKGDKVWLDAPHSDYNLTGEDRASEYLLPVDLDPKSAVFMPFVRIALGAVHDGRLKVGDNVVVFGLGLIGNLVCQIAELSGAEVIGFDVDRFRVDIAKKVGINSVLIKKDLDPAIFVRKFYEKGADCAIEASGNYNGLENAIRCCGVTGRVVTVGSYPSQKVTMRLGEEWQKNKVEMISSMTVNDCPHPDYPLWDLKRLNRTSLELLRRNMVKVTELITDVYKPENAAKAYKDLMNAKPTLGVIFRY